MHAITRIHAAMHIHTLTQTLILELSKTIAVWRKKETGRKRKPPPQPNTSLYYTNTIQTVHDRALNGGAIKYMLRLLEKQTIHFTYTHIHEYIITHVIHTQHTGNVMVSRYGVVWLENILHFPPAERKFYSFLVRPTTNHIATRISIVCRHFAQYAYGQIFVHTMHTV